MTTKDTTKKTAHKQPRHRSRAYPVIDLKEALERANVLQSSERFQPMPVEIALNHWGYKKLSSKGMRVLAALIQFGLLEAEGTGAARKVHLSQLARVIMSHPEEPQRKAAIQGAALKPSLYREIYEKHSGASDATLQWELTDSGALNETVAGSFIVGYRSTMAFAAMANGVTLSGQEGDKGGEIPPPDDPFDTQANTEMPEPQFQEGKPFDMTIMLPTAEEVIVRMPRKQDAATFDYMKKTLNTQLELLRPGITGEPPKQDPLKDDTDPTTVSS